MRKGGQGLPALVHQHGQVAAVIPAGEKTVIITVFCGPGLQTVQHGGVELAEDRFRLDAKAVAEIVQVIADGLKGDDEGQHMPTQLARRQQGIDAAAQAVKFLVPNAVQSLQGQGPVRSLQKAAILVQAPFYCRKDKGKHSQ